MARFVVGGTLLFGASFTAYLAQALSGVQLGAAALALVVFKTVVEIACSAYFFATLFIAGSYIALRRAPRKPKRATTTPPVGIVYLCCGDLDRSALRSLLRLRYPGRVTLVVHDDSRDPHEQTLVEAAVDEMRQESDHEIVLLRRPHREGGKAGAVNYVLDQTAHLYHAFLLCDNDSTVFSPWLLQRALGYLEDEGVAVVQCRTVMVETPEYSPINRMLARLIDAFHVVMTAHARFGWQPFIGHNALLRTRAVLEVGGLTPGFFADDLDLTVRLNFHGYSVVYAPALRMGEKHPPSYASLRKRSYKWAYGCVQVLKRHLGAVLASRQLCGAEKLSLLLFAGFYAGQAVLLLYLVATFVGVPLLLRGHPYSVAASLVTGSLLLLAIYLPILSYFLTQRRRSGWIRSALLGGLVYGMVDFAVARGVWDSLRGHQRQWTPTNLRSRGGGGWALAGEALFGAALLILSLLTHSPLLLAPSSYLFMGKFLFGPTTVLLYDDL